MPSLEFTLMVGCPLMCTFCPQDKIKEHYGHGVKYFQRADFDAIIAKLPKHVRVDFSGMAEPWANPKATDMLRHALESGFNVAVYTTLYGMLDADVFVSVLRNWSAQVEVVCLHLPDDNGNMRGWRHSEVYEEALRTVLAFGPELGGRFQVMSMDAGGRVHRDLQRVIVQTGAWGALSRAGNVDDSEARGAGMTTVPCHATAVGCSFTPFYDQNVVMPNGDVVLCCMDYALKHRIGNLLKQDYYTMFEQSPGLGRLLAENMQPRFSTESLCKTCERARPFNLGSSKHVWQ